MKRGNESYALSSRNARSTKEAQCREQAQMREAAERVARHIR